MLHLIFSLPGLYVLGRFVWLLPWLLVVEVAVGLLVLLASQYQRRKSVARGGWRPRKVVGLQLSGP